MRPLLTRFPSLRSGVPSVVFSLLVLGLGCGSNRLAGEHVHDSHQEDQDKGIALVAEQVALVQDDGAHARRLRRAARVAAVVAAAPAVHAPTGSWPMLDTRDVRDVVSERDRVFVATAGGLLVLGAHGVQEHWTVADGLASHDLGRLAYDAAHDTLWISHSTGGCQRWVAGNRLVACPDALNGVVITAWELRGTALLALTWRGALLQVDTHTDDVTTLLAAGALPAAAQMVWCGGRLWLASRGGGVGWLTNGAFVRQPGMRIVEALVCDADQPVIGGPEGVARWDAQGWTSLGAGGQGQVTALAATATGVVAGYSDGTIGWLLAPQGQTGAGVHVQGRPTRLVSSATRLWIATDGGLSHWDVGDAEPVSIALSGPGAHDIAAAASDGEVVALGFFRRGVALLADGVWQHVVRADGLPSEEVNGLVWGTQGELWVATSRGVARVERDGHVSATLASDALGCGHVNAITRVGSELVVATSCGVGLLEPTTNTITHRWTTADGLPHRIVYGAIAWQDRLIVGTNDGLAWRARSSAHSEPWHTVRAAPRRFTDNWVTALAEDRDGQLVVGTYSGGLFVGDLDAMRSIPGPRYVNLNAITQLGSALLVGGLSEGAWLVEEGQARPLARRCLPGDDVTAAVRVGEEVVVASRSGAWSPPKGCL